MSSDPILTAFASLVQKDPGHVLVRSPRREATTAAIEEVAQSIVRRLPSSVQAGTLVTLAIPNGPAFLAAFLALRRAGAAAILLDGRARQEDILRIARRMGAVAGLSCRNPWETDGEGFTLDEFPEARGQEHSPGGSDAQSHYSTKPPHLDAVTPKTGSRESTLQNASIAVVKMTSGSTGQPRGILTPAEALVADDAALARTMGLEADEKILAGIPFSHSYGLASVVMPALMRGSQLILPEAGRPFSLLRAGAQAGATFLPTVPAFLGGLLKMPRLPAWPQTLRLVISAGAPLAPDTARRFRQAFGLPVHVFYGSSESGGITYDREGTAAERGCLGMPVEGVKITLEGDALDPSIVEGGLEGVGAGRVVVSSPAVALGYWPRDEAAETPSTTQLARGTFRTSDLGRFHQGELVLLGRADRVINVRGKKVHPREVETVLLAMPGIDDAAVISIPAGDAGDQRIRAVVAGSPEALCPEEILRWCRDRLAEHKVPRSLILVAALPRTPRGKVDQKALRALAP